MDVREKTDYTTAVIEAYPTIPIIFVSSARDNRLPLHNSMGLSVTDMDNETRVETKITLTDSGKIDRFILSGEKLPDERLASMKEVLKFFKKETGKSYGVSVESNNYKVFSGSSDANFGHTSPLATFPIGGTAKISADENGVYITIKEH